MELTKQEWTLIMNVLANTPTQNLQIASELLNLYKKVQAIVQQPEVQPEVKE